MPASGLSLSGGVTLDRRRIDRVLPLVKTGLAKYLALQSALRHTNVSTDRDFQRAFNGFYRVRRGKAWQDAFYRALERQKSAPEEFAVVLRKLHGATARLEASFASKAVAFRIDFGRFSQILKS